VYTLKGKHRNHGLASYVPENPIVGHQTLGATRKPDIGQFVNLPQSTLKARSLDITLKDVAVVGDTTTGLELATKIIARACWCRYSCGDEEELLEIAKCIRSGIASEICDTE
jgi:phosphoglycolate phosphatase